MKENNILYQLRRKLQILGLRFTSYEFMSKIYYYMFFKRRLNLEEPKFFNEKIRWLALNYYPYNETVVRCTDKYEVRKYIEKKGLGHLLNDLIGVWDTWDEIDWKALPNQFALKCTHGARYNIICNNKADISEKDSEKKIKRWLKEDFSLFNAEKHYSKITPRVICEKYLGGNMVDYKFYCFHGEPKFFYVSTGFAHGDDKKVQMDYYNIDGTKAPFKRPDYSNFENDSDLPDNLEEMIKISKILSEDFPFVRVDLFSLNGKIYFSELTFTPGSGLMVIEPTEYLKRWGNYINLESLQNN